MHGWYEEEAAPLAEEEAAPLAEEEAALHLWIIYGLDSAPPAWTEATNPGRGGGMDAHPALNTATSVSRAGSNGFESQWKHTDASNKTVTRTRMPTLPTGEKPQDRCATSQSPKTKPDENNHWLHWQEMP